MLVKFMWKFLEFGTILAMFLSLICIMFVQNFWTGLFCGVSLLAGWLVQRSAPTYLW